MGGVARQLPVLSVDGHEPLGPGELDEPPLLGLLGVAGGVERRVAVPAHQGAAGAQLVDQPPHRQLVAGDLAGGEDHRVAGVHLQVGVLAARQPAQRGARLALASRW